jgi:glycosyltransferase involved in cell wall biosynthesis
VATEWGTGKGGVNAFNFGLAQGLAKIAPGMVACAVPDPSPEAVRSAENAGVLLLKVSGEGRDARPSVEMCGEEVLQALRDRGLPAQVDVWIGHDMITGPTAAAAAARHGGRVALIHHMDYLSYQNLGGGRGTEAADNHKAQIRLLSTEGAAVFGVGVWLKRNAERLSRRQAHLLVPGFPCVPDNRIDDGSMLRIVTAGRFECSTESVKRIGPAVEAVGRAIRKGKDLVSTLAQPSLTVLGAGGEVSRQCALETLARDAAGRPVNVIPAAYDPDPFAVADHLSCANLAIMPSLHEGFGLVGWEAIGTATPLILGRGTGLAEQLEDTLGVHAKGLVHVLDLDGTEEDVDRICKAVLDVARNLPRALRMAVQLRDGLKAELGCTWENAAQEFLRDLGQGANGASGSCGVPLRSSGSAVYADTPLNHFPRCVELSLSAGQGATRQSFELVAELRFGVMELDIDGIEAEIGLSRACVAVSSDQGRLCGARLGDTSRPVPWLEAQAGGTWIVRSDADGRLPNKALGDEALCRIETPLGQAASAVVEVTAAKRDIRCDIRSPKRKLAKATEKVMAAFLMNAVMKSDSGHVLFSFARIEEDSDA